MTTPKGAATAADRRIADAGRLASLETGVAGIKETLDKFIGRLDKRLDDDFAAIEKDIAENESEIKALTKKIYFFSGGIAVISFISEWIFHTLTKGSP